MRTIQPDRPLPSSNIADTLRFNASIKIPHATLLFLLLILISWIVYSFHIEENLQLPKLMPLVAGGFFIHAISPFRLRLPIFFFITIGAIIYLLGLSNGILLIGMALLVFYLANLRISVYYKTGIIVAMTGLAIALRAEWLSFNGDKIILPIIGSLFMFRMILFLHELKYEQTNPGIWLKLNYFFLLPNLVFIIFPVVDYSTFIRKYYSNPAFDTYRRGIIMICNGLLHLFIYRLIYYYLLPPPSAVVDVWTLGQFLIASYGLIVRLAGIFHFSAGIICLFGFHLPPVFDHYFFAHNFSDIWRRINIYWRDFMTRVFYYPIYFKLKQFGPAFGMVGAIILVFIINWFLHGWQWFWIRGSFPLTLQDILFWSIFGVAVAINTYIQIKQPRNPSFVDTFSWKLSWFHSIQIVAMFCTMTLLWTFWTSHTIQEWILLLQHGNRASAGDVILILFTVFLITVLGTVVQFYLFKQKNKSNDPFISEKHKLYVAVSFIVLMAIAGFSSIKDAVSVHLEFDLEPVYKTKLNAYDREQLYKGYYETLLVGSNLNSRIWEMEQQRQADGQDNSLFEIGIRRDDIMLKELKPNQQLPFKGGLLTTNNYGLRDKEYSKEKPDNTLRIVLIGGSIEMGVGVNTDETFENLVEEELNKKQTLGEGIQIEILNFAISGNHLFQNIAMFEKKAATFNPDIVLYAAHSNEMHRILHSIYKAYSTGRDLTYDVLYDLLEEYKITPATTESEFMNVLTSKQLEIALKGYTLLYKYAFEKGCQPIWMYVPTLDDNEVAGEGDILASALNKIGFNTFSIADAFEGYDPATLKLAEYDSHPNKNGHQLLAKAFIQQLENNQDLLKILKSSIKR